jgi:DNA-directed RNA polymerase subunit RPC12/RpoP
MVTRVTFYICKQCGEPFSSKSIVLSKKSKTCPYCGRRNFYSYNDILEHNIIYTTKGAYDILKRLKSKKRTKRVIEKIKIYEEALEFAKKLKNGDIYK